MDESKLETGTSRPPAGGIAGADGADTSPSAALRSVEKGGQQFRFWDGKSRDLIRQRDGCLQPEVWRHWQWAKGSPYVLDAITGMGEDPYSCGEWASDLSVMEAEAIAERMGIDPYAPNPDDDPGRTQSPLTGSPDQATRGPYRPD